MPTQAFLTLCMLGFAMASGANATDADNSARQPSIHSLAKPSFVATNKAGAAHVLPSPVIAETSASRQADGSIVLRCRTVKNAKATSSYQQIQPQRQSSEEQK